MIHLQKIKKDIMARKNQKLINYHTSGTTMPALTDVNYGEIVVRHNTSRPELLIKVSGATETFATFIASGAVHTAIENVNTRVSNLSAGTKNATGSLQTQITNIQNSITASTGSVQAAIDEALDEAKSYTDTEVGEVNAVVTGHTQSIATLTSNTGTLQTTLNATTGRVDTLSTTTINLQSQITTAKGVADAAQADVDALSGVTSAFSASVIAQLATKVATTAFTSSTGTLQTAIDAAKDDILEVSGKVATIQGSSHSHANKAVLDGITAAKVAGWDAASAASHTHANKTVLDTITTAKTQAWDSAQANAKSYTDSKISALVGSDTGKTIRTIANEEVAAQLIPEEAKDSLDTLQEIAAWIQNHPEDAAAMQADIEALSGKVASLQTATGSFVTNATFTAATGSLSTSITAADGRIKNLSGAVATAYATSANTHNAITTVNNRFASYATSANTHSAINAVNAKLVDYATTATVNTLTSRVSAAEDDILEVSGKVATIQGSSHSHGNKTVLDSISATTVTKANAAVTAATVTNQVAVGVVASVATNTLTLNFDDLVIDCGEF